MEHYELLTAIESTYAETGRYSGALKHDTEIALRKLLRNQLEIQLSSHQLVESLESTHVLLGRIGSENSNQNLIQHLKDLLNKQLEKSKTSNEINSMTNNELIEAIESTGSLIAKSMSGRSKDDLIKHQRDLLIIQLVRAKTENSSIRMTNNELIEAINSTRNLIVKAMSGRSKDDLVQQQRNLLRIQLERANIQSNFPKKHQIAEL